MNSSCNSSRGSQKSQLRTGDNTLLFHFRAARFGCCKRFWDRIRGSHREFKIDFLHTNELVRFVSYLVLLWK